MRIPTSGTGRISTNPGRSPDNKEIYSADLTDFKNLIEDFQHITLKQVIAFASWFMGDEGQLMTLHPPSDMTMKYLNVNTAGNLGLVACFKQECHTVLCLVWHTIKNHITTVSYQALLVCKKDFAYECATTGNVTYEGFTHRLTCLARFFSS
jgi:hypothetical protein